MIKKCGKFMADWRDSTGKRHRAAFPTEAEALAHQTTMRAAVNPKTRLAALRGPSRTSSKRTPGRATGGVDLDLLQELRVAIREETETASTDAAVKALAAERSGGMLRAMIETDAHIRAGEMLAALGAAAALEHNIRQLVELLTVVRDVEAAKKESGLPR